MTPALAGGLGEAVATPVAMTAPAATTAPAAATGATAGMSPVNAAITAAGYEAPAATSSALPSVAGPAPTAAEISAIGNPSSLGSSLSGGLKATNKFLGDYQPLIQATEQGASMFGGEPQGDSGLHIQMPQLMPGTPMTPQFDRLAFLRAFGMQG
jgi:hypothetical protein